MPLTTPYHKLHKNAYKNRYKYHIKNKATSPTIMDTPKTSSTAAAAAAAASSTKKPLNILDLPLELQKEIFKHVSSFTPHTWNKDGNLIFT